VTFSRIDMGRRGCDAGAGGADDAALRASRRLGMSCCCSAIEGRIDMLCGAPTRSAKSVRRLREA
jgi:hypothetical protein